MEPGVKAEIGEVWGACSPRGHIAPWYARCSDALQQATDFQKESGCSVGTILSVQTVEAE